MKLAGLALIVVVLAGCSSGESASPTEESPLPKTPNATAADNQKALANANMPESAKKIMGGGKS